MNDKKIIEAARSRFDSQLHTDEYKKIHSDDKQLKKLIDLAEISPGKNYIDIGTGNGYVAFSLAEQFPESTFYGLDISSDSINKNSIIAEDRKLQNAHFQSYDGFDFPFENEMFFGSFSRYAFHHFPNVELSISEIQRILEPGGFFLFSDPKTFENDSNEFVDEFQSLMPDGHVHFYRRSEIESQFQKFGFSVENEFETMVRYPRVMDRHYETLIRKTDSDILENYKIEVIEDKVFITVTVMNILFRKTDR